ncbi:sigma-70 family RNA polymerase sigma factor [Streptomyces sp. R302]|uniref:sigma-70 family RNA polymerase sigma factor n=1 Tax=unclassified Streptomyces TaxID=2593676 RepID=UPI00145E3EBB|nr:MULTISPECIES: sigma-70 family RNA polymerase sigma factor [unclassified Streptomyces]NML55217.1 sigma-70 family RNA polymerase sigma factor [Streptomyces sp. R301]NML82637.1 sigma-70 family RNA polymerase sigma factor [Streptomyces sp. R302]
MHSDEQRTTALVEAARAGDPHAREDLVRAFLPLVHAIVGRALDGHADTDDIVQETLVRALDGLPGLRDPERFRSWLVAIAMNGVRRRWRERSQAPVPGLDRAVGLADPAGDFTDLTILRLGLTGQRRDVARATRWLDEDDRELLSLWWLEAAGELTRAELAEGLGLPPAHTAVRVQRMKERLETGRAVVGALDADPRCPGLAATLAPWDGRPSPLWRKRIARHLRDCRTCATGNARRGLAPVEGLLVGIGLVPPVAGALLDAGTTPALAAEPAGAASAANAASEAEPSGAAGVPEPSGAAESAGAQAAPYWSTGRRAGAAGAAGVAAVAVLGALVLTLPGATEPPPAPRPAAAPPATTPAATTPPPTPTPSTVTTAATRPAPPTRTPTTTPPTPARTTPPPPADPGERVTELVNRLRADAGCAPLRTDPRLTAAARAYARDMTTRGYYGHASPEGEFADTRMTEAGYRWSAWAENLAEGQKDPASVVAGWRDDAGHARNMLDCSYRDTGVAAAPGPRGTVWVQKLAAPAN